MRSRPIPLSRCRRARWLCVVVSLAMCSLLAACGGRDDRPGVSLILKTQTNPYFVAMRQAAQAEAAKQGLRLSVAAGTQDGDTQNQINEIYTAIARDDKGILLTSNGSATNAAVRQAKASGLYVIALDTPLTPADTADNTFATDNTQAGRLIGRYAAAALDGKHAVIAMLDVFNDQVISVDVERDHGFLEGMGIPTGSKSQNGLEPKKGRYTSGKGGTYQVVCHRPSQGAIDGGRTAMEQCLAANPNINVVYSINEPTGQGASAALAAAGKTKQAMVVTVDGSCKGIALVRSGVFAADATQYPGKMARLGADAMADIPRGDRPPAATSGKNFLDTGTALATGRPLSGVPDQQSPDQAEKLCWGSAEQP